MKHTFKEWNKPISMKLSQTNRPTLINKMANSIDADFGKDRKKNAPKAL